MYKVHIIPLHGHLLSFVQSKLLNPVHGFLKIVLNCYYFRCVVLTQNYYTTLVSITCVGLLVLHRAPSRCQIGECLPDMCGTKEMKYPGWTKTSTIAVSDLEWVAANGVWYIMGVWTKRSFKWGLWWLVWPEKQWLRHLHQTVWHEWNLAYTRVNKI